MVGEHVRRGGLAAAGDLAGRLDRTVLLGDPTCRSIAPSSATIRALYASARTCASPANPTRPSIIATSAEIFSSKYSLSRRAYRVPVGSAARGPGSSKSRSTAATSSTRLAFLRSRRLA
jgi:hypothetical protein